MWRGVTATSPTKTPRSRQSPRGLLNFYRLTTTWLSSRRSQSGFYLFCRNRGSSFASRPGFPRQSGLCHGDSSGPPSSCLRGSLGELYPFILLRYPKKVKARTQLQPERGLSPAQTGGNAKCAHLTPVCFAVGLLLVKDGMSSEGQSVSHHIPQPLTLK